MCLRLFKGLEKGVLGGFIHGVGGSNYKKSLASLAIISLGEEVADLLNTNDTGGFVFAGADVDRRGEIQMGVGGHYKDSAASAGGDLGDFGKFFEEH